MKDKKMVKGLSFMLFLMLVVTACKPPKSAIIQTSLEAVETQSFMASAETDAIITAKGGSIFAFPKGAFTDEMGNQIQGSIEIKIQEARTLKEMFRAGLQTISDKGLLQTDGSYSIFAFQNGKPLKLNSSIGGYAYFPTDKKDSDMNLWKGTRYDSQVAWTLDAEKEGGIPACDNDAASRKRCKKCEKLVKLASKVKKNKKPGENEYWTKRYYYENGKLFYYSSGSATELFSKSELEDCRDFLSQSKRGRELLESVAAIQKEQQKSAGDYYSFRLNDLGWYNVDKLMKENEASQLLTFNGKVVDEKGIPVAGASVHFISMERKIHVMKTSEDGSFSMQFLPFEKFKIYAYDKSRAARSEFTISPDRLEISPLNLSVLSAEQVEDFLSGLM